MIIMIKRKTCPSCGTKFTGQHKYCSYNCALPAMVDAIEQLRNKKGPVYDKWKARIKEAVEKL